MGSELAHQDEQWDNGQVVVRQSGVGQIIQGEHQGLEIAIVQQPVTQCPAH